MKDNIIFVDFKSKTISKASSKNFKISFIQKLLNLIRPSKPKNPQKLDVENNTKHIL
jgi:hypothetical protein